MRHSETVRPTSNNYKWVKWYRYRSIEAPHGIGIELSKYRLTTGWYIFNVIPHTGADSSIELPRPKKFFSENNQWF